MQIVAEMLNNRCEKEFRRQAINQSDTMLLRCQKLTTRELANLVCHT